MCAYHVCSLFFEATSLDLTIVRNFDFKDLCQVLETPMGFLWPRTRELFSLPTALARDGLAQNRALMTDRQTHKTKEIPDSDSTKRSMQFGPRIYQRLLHRYFSSSLHRAD
jgi:hypothetical protein